MSRWKTWKTGQTETHVEHGVYLWVCAPSHPHALCLRPSPLSFSDVTFQFEDKKFFCSFGFPSFVSVVSTWCLWAPRKPGALPGSLVPLLHWFLPASTFERKRERERKRMIYLMDHPPLRPNRILIIKAWYSNPSRVWTDWLILGQLSLLEPPFAENNFFYIANCSF